MTELAEKHGVPQIQRTGVQRRSPESGQRKATSRNKVRRGRRRDSRAQREKKLKQKQWKNRETEKIHPGKKMLKVRKE